jgi:dTDP-4-dehydrorhamnose reductase
MAIADATGRINVDEARAGCIGELGMSLKRNSDNLEIWGGVECTVNRLGNDYMDQLALSGHDRRESDLDLFATLGIRAIRYPILWERTAPRGVGSASWSWADCRLNRLRQLGLLPIVGLVHHGSGPFSTRLDDDSFANGLADYAGAVAERFPWVERYTPVNEPLTTARFSGLYGHWYPHACSDHVFARALVNQCRGTVLAMRAIRRINSAAQLVQTEDLGKIYSTPLLAYQAEFENERRWVAFDLLCGRLARDMPLWHFLLHAGIHADELKWFVDNPCTPDIIGCDYYAIGERMLDEHVERYPRCLRGGNHQHGYADVDAVRVRARGLAGWKVLLREAWERFQLPIAVTEVHLGCHREAQIAWLLEAWRAANDLRAAGVDIRAITAWKLLGSYNWDTLVTSFSGRYESGVYDVGNGQPRATALASTIRALTKNERSVHPAIPEYGWWRQSSRLLYPAVCDLAEPGPADVTLESKPIVGPPVLIAGARGTLGRAFADACQARGLKHTLCSRNELDITDFGSIKRALLRHEPWVVVNAAGYVRVDEAESDADTCRRINTAGAAKLATACAAQGVRMLTFSSDLVFSGDRSSPYVESDGVQPLCVYGQSKADAEREVLARHASALVIRTSAFFGPSDAYNFLTIALEQIERGLTLRAADDWIVSPTYVPDLVHRCLDLLIDGEAGLWHLANEGALSWADFAQRGAATRGLDADRIVGCPAHQLGFRARRPQFSALGSQQGNLLPAIDHAILRYCEARAALDAARDTSLTTAS